MTLTVIVDPEAKADLLTLYEHLVERAEHVEDLDIADRALVAVGADTLDLADQAGGRRQCL